MGPVLGGFCKVILEGLGDHFGGCGGSFWESRRCLSAFVSQGHFGRRLEPGDARRWSRCSEMVRKARRCQEIVVRFVGYAVPKVDAK